MNNENLIQLIYDDIQEMKKQQVKTDERLDGMDKRLDGVDKRLDGVDKRLDEMDKRFVSINVRLDSLESKVLENTEGIRRINLCLENEIRPSIMRIAEGHLDLSRKLDEALKIDEEKEKMAIRLNFLEGKVDRLEVKVAALT